jgi:hypothetical protein
MGLTQSTEQNPLKWAILSINDAVSALEEAEARDEYIETIQESPHNRRAREPYVEWTPIDAPAAWTSLLSNIVFPSWSDTLEIKIICAPDQAEGGMPHTRPGGIICIPRNYSNTAFQKMMIHEVVHILQRRYYDSFMKFMKENWDFRLVTRDEFQRLPEALLMRRRINPDTFSCPFLIWRNEWIPIIVFNNHTDGPRLTSTYIVWWNVKSKMGINAVPSDWIDFFGNVSQAEHPFEIAAWYLSDNTLQSDAATLIRNKINSILK